MKEPIFTKNFILVFTSNFFIGIVMYGLQTIIAEYSESYGASALMAGIVAGVYTIGALTTRLGAAGWMEKLGWRRMITLFTVIHVVTCLLYFAASSLPLLVVVRFLHGLGFGATATAIVSSGMALVPQSRYGEGSGYLMMSPALSMAVGPYLCGLIMDRFGGTGCFALSVGAALGVVILMAMTDLSSIDPGPKKREVCLQNRPKFSLQNLIEVKAVPVSCVITLVVMGYSGPISFVRPFGAEEGINGGAFFLTYALVLLFARPFAGKLQDKKGDNAVAYPVILMQAVGLALMAFRPCTLTIMIAAAGTALGFGSLSSCIQAICGRMTAPERRPYAITTFWILCDGGMGTGPMILGGLVSALGYRGMFYGTALITLLALPLYYFTWGKKEGKKSNDR